jgi:hypothetical protein
MNGISPDLDPDIIAKEGTFYAIQSKVLEYLRALPLFASVPLMFIEDAKTIDNDLKKAMTGLEPMSICVALADWQDTSDGVPGRLEIDGLVIVITVFENPIISRKVGGINVTLNRALECIACNLKCERIQNGYLTKPRTQGAAEVAGKSLSKSLTFRLAVTVYQSQTEEQDATPQP